jgi:hypothetical protein
MKAKLFILIGVTLSLTFKSFGQAGEKHIPLIILVDGDIPSVGISKGAFLIENTDGRVRDSIPFTYRVNSATITDRQSTEVHSLTPKDMLVIKFRYNRAYSHVGAEEESYDYETKIDAKYINDAYLILKVYNYANPANTRFYTSKQGYGIEVSSPNGGTLLPLRKPTPYKPLKKWSSIK